MIAVVAGALANKAGHGGAAWTRLSWALGLRSLGLDVRFVEEIAPAACVDAAGAPTGCAASINLAYFRAVMERFGFAGAAALLVADGSEAYGATLAGLDELAGDAGLLVNISGNLTVDRLKARFRRKVFIDLDPGYTQSWHAAGLAAHRLAGHDLYFTVGENIGRDGCAIPEGGIRWRPIRQPIPLEYWPVLPAPTHDRFTTVASWRGPYGRVPGPGGAYGVKAHEFRKFITLPRRTRGRFEVAIEIHPGDEADRRELEANGWHLLDPAAVAGTPDAFRAFVQRSSAEFSVAQGIYVDTQSGWFSDRTTRYLASGRPALVQDTGFSRNYPVGEGLVAFHALDEAVAGAESIARDYDAHARAARALAEEFFDARRVLTGLLDAAGVSP